MRDAAVAIFLLLFIITGGSLMIGRNPPPPTDMKPLSALQMDILKERYPDIELEYPWRARFCRNEVWWYFYANHDAGPSTRNCW